MSLSWCLKTLTIYNQMIFQGTDSFIDSSEPIDS